uniref:Uncharacterized protein n=1 Tax=Ditylenchus dipsaci TaxID=166011 RepID=A0A915ERI0_9BILA
MQTKLIDQITAYMFSPTSKTRISPRKCSCWQCGARLDVPGTAADSSPVQQLVLPPPSTTTTGWLAGATDVCVLTGEQVVWYPPFQLCAARQTYKRRGYGP